MIRAPRRSDQAYIASTWVRSLVDRMRPGPRYGEVGKNVDTVLDRGDTRAALRVAKHDHDLILGYVVYAEGVGVPLVHYCYVRKHTRDGGLLRQRGIASELLEHVGVKRGEPVVCTSLGPDSRLLRAAYPASVHLPLREFLL